MFLALVDIHGCISFNIIVITKIETNAILTCGLVYAVTNFWLCAISDLFRVIIFASLVNFTVCAICCNLDSQITPSTEDFKLQQTEMACLMVSETKLIVNHHSFGSYKTKQVKSSVNCLPLCPMRTI